MNIKICTKCGKIGLYQLDFYINYDKRDYKYYYRPQCKKCETVRSIIYQENDPERKKIYSKQYRKDNAEHIKQYYIDNAEHRSQYNKQWRDNNVAHCKNYSKQYRKDNAEYEAKRIKNWNENNKDKRALTARKRRNRVMNIPGSHTIEELKFIYDNQEGKCPCCNEYIPYDKMTVDHIIPVSWEGSTDYVSNIQLLCKSCNSSKGNRNAIDFRKTKE